MLLFLLFEINAPTVGFQIGLQWLSLLSSAFGEIIISNINKKTWFGHPSLEIFNVTVIIIYHPKTVTA